MKYVATLFLIMLVFNGCRKEPKSPRIETGVINNNSSTTAITKIFFVDPVISELIEAGVCFSEQNSNPSINDSISVLQSDNNNIVVLRGLKPNTEYWYRAYAIMENELVYGSIQKFKTMADTANLISIESLNIISGRQVNLNYFIDIDRDLLSSSGILATYTINDSIYKDEILSEVIFPNPNNNLTLYFFNNEESISLKAFAKLFGGSKVYSEPVSVPQLKKLLISNVEALSFRCLKFSVQFDDHIDLRYITVSLSRQYFFDKDYFYCYNPTPPSCDFIVFDLIPDTIYTLNGSAIYSNHISHWDIIDYTPSYVVTMPDLPDIGVGSLDKPLTINGIYYLEESAEEKWVKGRIIGTFSSEGVLDISPPYEDGISIAIADEPDEIYSRNAASLEFYNAEVPQDLNLVEHPEVIGKTILVKGSFERTSNKNMIIKNILEYELLE